MGQNSVQCDCQIPLNPRRKIKLREINLPPASQLVVNSTMTTFWLRYNNSEKNSITARL